MCILICTYTQLKLTHYRDKVPKKKKKKKSDVINHLQQEEVILSKYTSLFYFKYSINYLI